MWSEEGAVQPPCMGGTHVCLILDVATEWAFLDTTFCLIC